MGTGRLSFFFKKIALFIQYTFIVFLTVSSSFLSWGASVLFLVFSAVTIYLNYRLLKSRLANMGFDTNKTWIWLLLDFVPLLNLGLFFFMSLYPHHQHHRKH